MTNAAHNYPPIRRQSEDPYAETRRHSTRQTVRPAPTGGPLEATAGALAEPERLLADDVRPVAARAVAYEPVVHR
jgi:hypothetical protein